jgi:hypothetical protein
MMSGTSEIRVAVSYETKKRIAEAAKARGESMAEWCRRAFDHVIADESALQRMLAGYEAARGILWSPPEVRPIAEPAYIPLHRGQYWRLLLIYAICIAIGAGIVALGMAGR